jgi:pre-mRNA 3'-end-processing factor FIP1
VKRETTQDARLGSQPPNERPGTDYPARHTSKLDPNGNPVHPATGKPILSTDFDVDFPSESSKPWRKPGADITDYFNYGFDEFTWASYCLKQQQMPKEVKEITQQAEQMKAFVEGIPGGGMGGMPGMPGMPGAGAGGDMSGMAMPNEAQMQQMFAAMASQGLDPSSMDPSQFMQFMSGPGANMMGGPQPPTGPAASFGGQGGGFDGGGPGGGGGFGGRGRGKGGRRNW